MAVDPLKAKQLLLAFGGPQDRGAVGPMSPRAEFTSRNFHLSASDLRSRSELLEVGAGLPQWSSVKLTWIKATGETQTLRARQRPALRRQSRSPLAPSTHVVAGVEHKEMRCLT